MIGRLIDLIFIDIITNIHPFKSVREYDADCSSRVNKDSSKFEVSDHEVDDEWITVGLIDSTSLLFLEGDYVFWDVAGWRPGRPVRACFSLTLVTFDG